MKLATFLMMYFFKNMRSNKDYIQELVTQAKEQAIRSKDSSIAFFNQILDDLSWFDISTRKLVTKARKEVQNA